MLAILAMHIPSTAAGTGDEWYAVIPTGTWRINAIRFAPATAVAINGTNFTTVTFTTNDGAAGADVALASHTTNTGGQALVLKTSISVAFTATGVQREVSGGQQIKVAKVESGTGAILDGTYTIELIKVN